MDKPRILIVDDEISSSRLLKANLDLTGRYEVRVENRPDRAAEAARQFRPHLALLDAIMPLMSGTHLAAVLQADPELRVIRIIFLTAAEAPLMDEEAVNGLSQFPCINKPASMEEILPCIERNLPP
jgi:two-component system, OmpR family, response regulator